MRVGLNLLYLIPGVVGGTETYAAGLLSGLARIDSQDEFLVFVNQESTKWPVPVAPNVTRIVCNIAAVSRVRRYFFEQIRFPHLLKKYRVDLVHSLGYVGPLLPPCPAVVTVPDANFVDLAYTMPWSKRISLRLFSIGAACLADHIITISYFSEGRLRAILGNVKRISVTHLGPRAISHSTLTYDNVQALMEHYGISKPYIVAFGGTSSHKNIPALLQAFVLIAQTIPHNLVLIGHLPSNVNLDELNEQPLRERIVTTGYVPDEHIYPLLSHAELFVLPSLYEGFGLPILEAQQAGVAVACSSAGSLPEVAGEGAVFFDPTSVQAIAQTMTRCLSNPDLRATLRKLGRENLKRFSWERTAHQTLAVYREVLSKLISSKRVSLIT